MTPRDKYYIVSQIWLVGSVVSTHPILQLAMLGVGAMNFYAWWREQP
jgi:hypothetical protein